MMAVTHVNFKGDTYFLHQTSTEDGAMQYYFSKDKSGVIVEKIPDGYEFYEDPNGVVLIKEIDQ